MTSYIEQFDALLVIPLNCWSPKEHVCNLSKSERRMRLSKKYVRWNNINVPLCKICTKQDKQMDDVGETKWKTWKKHKEYAHAFVNKILRVDTRLRASFASQILTNVCADDDLLEEKDIRKAGIARQVNG